jgi:Kef-type K+ transport system membrane component KefB
VILGAAVIDDVLGLVTLAVAAGAIATAETGTALSIVSIAVVLFKAIGFLGLATVLGWFAAPRLVSLGTRFRTEGTLLVIGLVMCFTSAWLASQVGLAPIIGAFAAGLVLEPVHYRSYVDRGERGLDELVHPMVLLVTPVFFVVMGMQTDLRSLSELPVIALAGALVLVAVAGKLLGAFGVVGRGIDRWSVAIGMVPRGEVGLIFASIGQSLSLGGRPLVDEGTLSAIVLMVIATTIATPPALRWSLRRGRHRRLGA